MVYVMTKITALWSNNPKYTKKPRLKPVLNGTESKESPELNQQKAKTSLKQTRPTYT